MKLNRVSRALGLYRGAGCISVLAPAVWLAALPMTVNAEEVASDVVEDNVEVIEVRGLRGTMTRSLNEKKNNDKIVDAIAASDFGELPGLSISDIIENIPSASGHRLKGSQNEISIRGLGSYWGYSTFNGRTITNAGPGRAVNFKKFPSDLVDKVVIYKSQSADLVEGGTSGTIDISSLRALDYGRDETNVTVEGIYNSYYEDVEGDNASPWGSKFVLSTVQNFDAGALGAMGFTFGFSYQDTANPEENYGGSSQMGVCALRDADGNPLSDNGETCFDDDSDQAVSAGRVGRRPTPGEETDLANYDPSSIFYVPADAFWRTGTDEDTRKGIVVTYQWQPNDRWDINLDYEQSRLEYHENRMEFGIDSRAKGLTDHIIADDHTLLYAKGIAKAQLNGESRYQWDDYDGGGLNIEFLPNDQWWLALDLSYSKSERYRLRHRTKMRTNSRYAYEMDFRGSNVPTLNWLANGGDPAFDMTQMSSYADKEDNTLTYAEYRRSHDDRTDDIWAVKFDSAYALDNNHFSALKAGVRYSREHLLDFKTNDVSIDPNSGAQKTSAYKDSSYDPSGLYQCQNNHQNNNLFDEERGGVAPFPTYDAECFIGNILGGEFYDIGEREDGRSGSDVDVREDILALYLMADIDSELLGMPMFGNVGVRMVRNETRSYGWGDKVYLTSNDDGTFETAINASGEIEQVNLESDWTEYLPSLNLTFELTPEWYLRTGIYRALSRFQMNAMSSGVAYTTCADQDSDLCDETSNTDLREAVGFGDASGNHMNPYTSTNYDLSLEYYPSEDAAYSIALYWKDFTGGYVQTTEDRDVVVSLDGVDTVVSGIPHTVRQTDDKKSTIKGVEISAQKHFSELPAPFDGLGTKLAYNYADSDFVTPEYASPVVVADANLFGFSDTVASASVYWEGESTTLRLLYKYRSEYFQPNSLPFPDRSHRYVQDSDYLDFSAKYKVNNHLTLNFKALNLLDEPQVMTRGNGTTIADYSRSGAKYFAGVKVQF
ncbi:TonB-dependent receptor [Ferrimonas senticii]|uniref:TonB-dependent receptor n=1 Tax=Ferrimonas senticii TaxID=394566 RepID=UPI000A05EB65|nr:TonB-dependent receptor [Ferrimonas senticii]